MVLGTDGRGRLSFRSLVVSGEAVDGVLLVSHSVKNSDGFWLLAAFASFGSAATAVARKRQFVAQTAAAATASPAGGNCIDDSSELQRVSGTRSHIPASSEFAR